MEMIKMIQLNESDFAETVFTKPEKLFIVQFTATWCSVCEEFQPILDKLEVKFGKTVDFVKIDVDECPILADQYTIDTLTTFLMLKNQEIIDCIVGAESFNQFKDKINEALVK